MKYSNPDPNANRPKMEDMLFSILGGLNPGYKAKGKLYSDTGVLFNVFWRRLLFQMRQNVHNLEGMLDQAIKETSRADKKSSSMDDDNLDDSMPDSDTMPGSDASFNIDDDLPFSSLNPFDILEIDFMSSEKEVHEAYKKKAWQYHPDRGGDNKHMQFINLAYEAICKFKGWNK